MAKSRKTNRRASPTRQTAFFEALPIVLVPPATVPGLRDHLAETAAAWAETAYKFRTATGAVAQTLINWRPTTVSAKRALARGSQAAVRAARRGRRTLAIATNWAYVQTKQAGLATTDFALHTSRLAAYAAHISTQAASAYTPPVAADVGHYARRSGRALSSKRARIAYLITIGASAVAVIVTGSMVAVNTLKSYAYDISSPAALMATKKTGTVILDRNGKVLFAGYGAQATQPVALNDMPADLKNATIAAEDPSFYSNPGFSAKAIARATWVDLAHQNTLEGGSTITQQLVKNALLNSNKNLQRKFQEFLLSVELTKRYTKDQILNMYLNAIYYGQGATGVEAASETYFHQPVSQLTLGQSALLAGLPLGPSRFDPNFDLQSATDRRNYVLDRMQQLGKITAAQANAAKAQPIQLAAAGAPHTAPADSTPMIVYAKQVNIQAPWFVFYVLDQLRSTYGDDVVEQGGITVKTTLDLDKENAAEQIIAKQITSLSSHNVTDGALISLDPSTGDIISMVGSADYNAPGFGNVNATLSQLQPGSSFKPIAYATAFEKGWTGATQIDDSPFCAPGGDGTQYCPQNYDLHFHGQVTIRHALDNSLNIPAVKTLQFATIPATLDTAHAMGITSLNDPSQYGLSLVLGGGDVSPIDMATVYATFDNGGVKVQPRAILKVTDRHGADITKSTQAAPKAVLDPRIAYMITNILTDAQARLPEFPLNGPLQLSGRPAAAKTGTTNDFRDNWTIGYTPQVVTAVWVGNADHSAMENVDGITGAAPIWHDYMELANAGLPVRQFTAPAGISLVPVCADGGVAQAGQPASALEAFLSDAIPTRPCNINSQPKPDNGGNPTDSSQPNNGATDNGNGNNGSPPGQSPIDQPPGGIVQPLPPARLQPSQN